MKSNKEIWNYTNNTFTYLNTLIAVTPWPKQLWRSYQGEMEHIKLAVMSDSLFMTQTALPLGNKCSGMKWDGELWKGTIPGSMCSMQSYESYLFQGSGFWILAEGYPTTRHNPKMVNYQITSSQAYETEYAPLSLCVNLCAHVHVSTHNYISFICVISIFNTIFIYIYNI